MSPRQDGRIADQLRPVCIETGFSKHAEGSVLIECGDTRVACTASVEAKVPRFLKGKGQGWVTAEYGMLPRSTGTRMTREVTRGRPSGRTQEIQRLIGRSLRSVVDLKRLGERTFWVDCDVIQADGGTRTASITGAFVALGLAVQTLIDGSQLDQSPLLDYVAGVSVGIVDGIPLLDLAYDEDSVADVDMNVVMTGAGTFVEVQGTAEADPFSWDHLQALLGLSQKGIDELIAAQRLAIGAQVPDLAGLISERPAEEIATPVSNPK